MFELKKYGGVMVLNIDAKLISLGPLLEHVNKTDSKYFFSKFLLQQVITFFKVSQPKAQ